VRDVAKSVPSELHPRLAEIAFLVGRWAGEGTGEYPSVESFAYGEEVTFSHVGKPYLAYTQRSWDLADGRPLHAEMGYWRCPSRGVVEVVLAHPSGHVEISEGTVDSTDVVLRSEQVLGTHSAKEVTALVRRIRVGGDHLRYELEMQAVGIPLGPHLRGALERVAH
jgi:hypothetical protein